MTHRANEGRSPAGRPGTRRLLPIAGLTAAGVAVLAHLGGGAALMHLGGGAVLAKLGFGAVFADLGGGALVLGLATVVAVKLLLVFGARHWWRHR